MVIDFISVPVIAGFTSAAAITIASSQVKSVFGLEITHHAHWGGEGILKTWAEIVENFDSMRTADTILGLVCIVILLLMRVSSTQTYVYRSSFIGPRVLGLFSEHLEGN